MSFIVRRKDPPQFVGATTYWITVAHHETREDAEEAKKFSNDSPNPELVSGLVKITKLLTKNTMPQERSKVNAISWYGGKQRLARQIISVFPEHEHYVEVFFGGGSIFFNKPKAPINTINDFNSNLVNLYVTVRDRYDELAEKMWWTLCSREQYDTWIKEYRANELKDLPQIDRALAYLFLIKMSFSNQVDNGFSIGVTNNRAHFNHALIEGLRFIRKKLDGVMIENRSFEEIIRVFGRSKNSFLYLDPPYYITIEADGYYEKTLTPYQHELLAAELSACKAPWVLSYDDLPEVIELYKNFHIMRLDVNYVHGREDIKKTQELLIANFRMRKPQLDIFDENAAIEATLITDEEKEEASAQVKHDTQEPVKKIHKTNESNNQSDQQSLNL